MNVSLDVSAVSPEFSSVLYVYWQFKLIMVPHHGKSGNTNSTNVHMLMQCKVDRGTEIIKQSGPLAPLCRSDTMATMAYKWYNSDFVR
jgi:hypothetical protein